MKGVCMMLPLIDTLFMIQILNLHFTTYILIFKAYILRAVIAITCIAHNDKYLKNDPKEALH